MNYDELFRKWIDNEWKVCIYGLGYLGRRLFKTIPDMMEIKIDMYSDSDRNKVDSAELIGLQSIYAEDLLKIGEDVVVLIMADDPYDDEIENMLSVNEYLHTITLRKLTHLDRVIEKFYGESLYRKYLELPSCN